CRSAASPESMARNSGRETTRRIRNGLYIVGSSFMLASTASPSARLRLRNAEIPAYFPNEVVVDFSVSRNRRNLIVHGIDVDAVLAPIPQQVAPAGGGSSRGTSWNRQLEWL